MKAKTFVFFTKKLWSGSKNRADSKNNIGFGHATLKIAVRIAFLNSQKVSSHYAHSRSVVPNEPFLPFDSGVR